MLVKSNTSEPSITSANLCEAAVNIGVELVSVPITVATISSIGASATTGTTIASLSIIIPPYFIISCLRSNNINSYIVN